VALIKPITGFPNNSTIDVATGSVFYTVIQGASSIVTGYSCKIFNADTFEEIYSASKIELEKPLTAGQTLEIEIPGGTGMENDSSYFWTVRLYQKQADIFMASSSVQRESSEPYIYLRSQSNIKPGMEIRIGKEQRKIMSYDISMGGTGIDYPFPNIPDVGTRCEIYSDFVESIGFPFKTRQTPIVKIAFGDQTGKSRTGKFYGSFDESIIVQIQWFRVIIYDVSLNIFNDSEKIFSSSLYYEYPNFSNHQTYYIQYVVQTVDDIFIESELKELTVVYDTFTLDTDIGVTANCDSTITLEWKEDRKADGIATGNYSFIYMGIETILGMTVDGVALPQRYYAWLDTEEGIGNVWNDDYFWTESKVNTEPAKRLQVLSGYIYYNQANDTPLDIDFNDFTIMSDVFIPANQTGTIISAVSSDGDSAVIKIENGAFVYTINSVVKTTFPIDLSALARYKIALTPVKATIMQTSVQ